VAAEVKTVALCREPHTSLFVLRLLSTRCTVTIHVDSDGCTRRLRPVAVIRITDKSYWYVLVIMDHGKFVIDGTHAQMCVRRNKCVMLVYV